MAQAHDSPHLKCELNIIRMRNLDLDLSGNLFIRYYVFAGNRRRVRVDTREIPVTIDPLWNELASLECRGASDPIGELLERDRVVFELRWRKNTTILGRFTRSKLLGRAEVSWRDVLGSRDMMLEKWITIVTTSRVPVGFKPPALLLRMRVQVSEDMEVRRVGRKMEWKECDCSHCEWFGGEEDMSV